MTRDYAKEIHWIIQSREPDEDKKKKILSYHESDIADALMQLDKQERLKLYRILGKDRMAEIFSYLDDVETYIEEIPAHDAADIIEQMDSDDALDVLTELDEANRNQIVLLMEKERVDDIRLIRQYSDDQIGSKMTNNFILIDKENTVRSAMKTVVSEAATHSNVSTIYVEDENHRFYGAIDLRDLIIARENDDFQTVIKQNYPAFAAKEAVDEVLLKCRDYGLDSYPILNEDFAVIGVITADDVVEAIDEELGEDYAKLGGLTEEEDLKEPVFQSVKKRLPWLVILLFLGLVVSSLISGFEHVVAALPVVVFFQSMILDMAGNTGTQSLAVTIRLLSHDEITKKEILKTIAKEFKIGFLNGLVLAMLAFGFVYLFLLVTKQAVTTDVFSHLEALKAAGIVGISLFLSMTVCSLVGSLIPILFMKLKIDPAVASGPLITTINDVLAVLVYYGLAALIFLNL